MGISHLALLEPIIADIGRRGLSLAPAHQALIDAHRRLMEAEPGAAHDGSVEKYWTTAAPHHYLEAGNSGDAVAIPVFPRHLPRRR